MRAPRIPSLFRSPKPKRFDYKPLKYDATKEELNQRVAQIEKEVELQKEGGKEYELRMSLREKRNRKFRNSELRKSNNRIVLIAGILLLVAYFILR